MSSINGTSKITAKTKGLIALAAAGVLLSQVSFAQPDNNEDRHEQRRQHMQEQFGVTDEQFSQMREIRENGGNREDMKEVFTDDQRQQMHTWREQNPREGGPHGKRNGKQKGQGSQDDSG